MRAAFLGTIVLAAAFCAACNSNGQAVNPLTGQVIGPSPSQNIGVQSVTVTPPSATIPAGSTIQLAVSVVADASTLKTVTWTSSSSSVASIDENGRVTGVSAGTATIIATSTVDASKAGAAVITVQGVAPPPVLITFINGTYAGSGTADTNSCNFSGTAPMTGVLNVNGSGVGTWVLTHTAANVIFNETIQAILTNSTTGAASFTGSSTQTIGGQPFSVTDSGTVSGNTLTDVQTLTRQGSSPCTVRYNIVLSKQ